MALAPEFLRLAGRSSEVTLITYGRKTGKPIRVVIWFCTDGSRLFVRAGDGLTQHWPQNLLARPEAELRLGGRSFKVDARHLTEPEESRAVSRLLNKRYGAYYTESRRGEPPTPGEQATFELIPAV
jgi:deazaflavin-dependent oxidoreductase (nitroreductase family)